MPRGVSRYDEARLQGQLWTPAQWLGSKLISWQDASDFSTITASAAPGISRWADKSGYGYDQAQATSANQPTLIMNPWAGAKSGVNFAAASAQVMQSSKTWQQTITAGQVFYVLKLVADPAASNASSGALIYRWTINSTAEHEPYTDGSVYSSFGSSTRQSVSNSRPNLTSPRIISISSMSNDWRYMIDGALIQSFGVNTTSFGFTAPQLGGPSGFYTNGVCGEIIFVNESLSAVRQNEAQKVEGYLAHKWSLAGNLAASHPFKNRPPLIGD